MILRLIETQSYRSVGGLKQRKANFRLICASHKNLLSLVEQGLFRRDLYYRIAGFPINLPSLQERSTDIPDLCQYFLTFNKIGNKRFSDEAITYLCQYPFPGNIRELKNTVEHAALLANEDVIEFDDLPEHILEADNRTDNSFNKQWNEHQYNAISTDSDVIPTLEEVEAEYLEALSKKGGFTIDDLASKLHLSSRTLYRKLHKYGIKLD